MANIKMSPLETAIIKTLVYYDALGQYPLTAIEICRYLQKQNIEIQKPSLADILKTLKENQIIKEIVQSQNGFFFLKNRQDLYGQRIFRQKIAIIKWRKIKKIAAYLVITPFLKGLAVSGSLSLNNTRPDSDLDFLIFTAQKRIWTCRTILSFLLQIIGQRRHDSLIADKICLNHYVAEHHFDMRFQNLSEMELEISNSHLYSHLVPLYNFKIYHSFLEKNAWVKEFISYYPFSKNNTLHLLDENNVWLKIGEGIARSFEFIFNLFFGDSIEKKLEAWQTNRIKNKTNYRGLKQNELYLSDTMLLFHYPICKNNEAVHEYKKKLETLSLS